MTPTMRFSSFASRFVAAFVTVTLAATSAAAQTFGSGTPDNAAGPFGRDSYYDTVIASIAQTFVVPADSPQLQSFSFFLSDYYGGAGLQLQSSVFAFSGSRLVGPALFSSAIRAGSGNEAGYDALSFSGVDLLLTPGIVYALVLRTAGGSPDGSTNFVGTTTGDTFSLGQLYTSTGSSDAELATAGAFTASTASTFGADAAVRVTFGAAAVTTVPEPASMALLAAGLVGVALTTRRRRRS